MFKKLHSNREPGVTVYSEVKREFGVYFGKAATGSRHMIERFPKLIFGLMITLMLFSLVLSFTVFRHPEPAKAGKPPKPGAFGTVQGDFNRILETGEALKKIISLKKEVDSISSQPRLTKQDSVRLSEALDQLAEINNRLKPSK